MNTEDSDNYRSSGLITVAPEERNES